MKRYYPILLILLVLSSCRKEPSKISGTNSLIYEADEYVDLMTNFSLNDCILNVENVEPYGDIMGSITTSAAETRIDGKPAAISNIEISEVHISELELYSGFDIAELDEYLENAEVILKYLDGSANYVSISLGTLSNVSTGENKVHFNESGADLTSFLLNNPDKLLFQLSFNGVPSSAIDVKYRVVFDYKYSYDEQKVK